MADGPALRGVSDATNDDPRPVDWDAMEAIGAGLLELDPELLAKAGVTQPRDRGIGAAGKGPAWQDRMQVRIAGEVRVGVEGDVNTARASRIDDGQQLGRTSLVVWKAKVRMRKMERNRRGLSGGDRLGVRLDRVRAVVAMVGRVERARATQHATERDHLALVGEHSGRVGETRRQAERSLGEGLAHEVLHLPQLVGRWCTVVGAHHEHADRAVTDKKGDVRRYAGVEAREIVGHAPPTTGVIGIAVPAGQRTPQLGLDGLVGRREAQPILANHLERHALTGLRLVGRVGELDEIAVRVHVNKPGCDDETSDVESRRRSVRDLADLHDLSVTYRDIGAHGWRARAVDHLAAAQQQVKRHRTSSPDSITSSRVITPLPAVRPPSTGKTAPVIQSAASEARKATACAMSSGSPMRPNGYQRSSRSKKLGSRACRSSWTDVRIEPGMTMLARTPCGPYRTASDWVRLINPALPAE